MPNTPGLECFGETGFSRSRELLEHFKPRLWLFGHHHKWFSCQDGTATFQGLAGSWKGYCLLDDNFQIVTVEHDVSWQKTPLIDRLLMKLRIISPDGPTT